MEMATTVTPLTENVSQAKESQRERWILYMVYAQIVFLALTYVFGVWLGTEIPNSTLSTPQFVVHGLLASTFALLSVVVGFLAALEKQRRVGFYNLLLFFITVVAGASGFAFLGNSSSSNQILQTNLSMTATIGIAMPITAYTLDKILKITSDGSRTKKSSPVTVMTYFALVALSFTIVAGAAVKSIAFYAFAVVLHVGLAALTISLVLGIVVLSVLEGSSFNKSGVRSWVPQRVAYSLLGLAAVSIAGGDGVITVTIGGISYVVVMAELSVLVYAFLILTILAPLRLNSFSLLRRSQSRALDSNER